MTRDRFDAGQTTIWDFGNEFFVECPACQKIARVTSDIDNSKDPAKFTCLNCGRTKEKQVTKSIYSYASTIDNQASWSIMIGAPVDWYFHYPLWLQQQCCGQVFWVYNEKHLDWMKKYIGAKLRTQKKDEQYGYSNQSLASRLPKWIQSASNRLQLLKAIEKLEAKLR